MSPLRREQPTVVALEHELAGVLATSASTESERDRLAMVLDACRDGVVVVDADGNEVYRNAAAERYREARHADAVAASNIAALLEEARQGTSWERELGLFGPPRAMLELHAVPLRDDGDRIVGAAVFIYDVSEIHRVESVRRDFVANVSHELKTPIGALEVLAETIAAESDPAVTRPARRAHGARSGAARSHRRRSAQPQPDRDPGIAVRDPMPIDALVHEAVDRVRPAAIVAGIELARRTTTRRRDGGVRSPAGRERDHEPGRQRDQVQRGREARSIGDARRRRATTSSSR